jgi:hypothetical protein
MTYPGSGRYGLLSRGIYVIHAVCWLFSGIWEQVDRLILSNNDYHLKIS